MTGPEFFETMHGDDSGAGCSTAVSTCLPSLLYLKAKSFMVFSSATGG